MYADVVVLTPQAPDINYFTYLVPKNLEKEIKVGQLVQVPFGSRNPVGIVLSIVNRPSTVVEKVKPITSILIGNPILLPYQVELLDWMSAYYIAPMVNCLEAILPELPKRVARLEEFPTARSQTNEQNSTIEFRKRALAGGKVATGPAQILVLVPTINRIPQTLAQFKNAKNYAIYHNKLKASEKFATWLKILSGDADHIFGSRSAIFLPCPNLAQIIIFDEHDAAYKDERSPYFDTLTVAQKISSVTDAEIKIIDPSPKISTYFTFKENSKSLSSHSKPIDVIASETKQSQGKLSEVSPPRRLASRRSRQVGRSFVPHSGTQDDRISLKIELPKTQTKSTIVDMQKERLAGNFSPISQSLLSLLKKNQKFSKNSLLFLNKKKESGSLYCKDCKNHQHQQTAPDVCPNCQSPNIYFNILNITSLAKEVQKQIPGAKVNLISENVFRRSTIDYRQSIDIATATIFYAPHLKKYDLVAYITPDSQANRADFSSNEVLYEQITNLKKLLTRNGLLLLQTASFENLVLKTAASGDFLTYYKEQLKLRHALFYPPFALLVKLTLKEKSDEKVRQKAEDLTRSLRLTMNDEPASPARSDSESRRAKRGEQPAILGPFPPFFFSKMPTFNIIIKYKLDSYSLDDREDAVNKLQNLRNLKDVQVTVEPGSIN